MLWIVLGGILFLVVVLFVWGVLHLRHSQRAAFAAIANVSPDRIPELARECETVFASAFGKTLSLDDLEASARILSDSLDAPEPLKGAFAKPDLYWHFVLPVGAYLGELIRMHARGEWHASGGGGVEMRVPVGDGSATTHPFEKVMKQLTVGDKGDVYAYLVTASRLEEALPEEPAGDGPR